MSFFKIMLPKNFTEEFDPIKIVHDVSREYNCSNFTKPFVLIK